MDRTLLNIASLFIGGAGLFAVLTKFYVPEIDWTFWGQNAFALKREVIDSVMTFWFATVAVLGLLLQLWGEIWGAHLPARRHDSNHYLGIAVLGFAVLGLAVWGLYIGGSHVARLQWQPQVIALQTEAFEQAKFVAEHDGWTPEHLAAKESIIAAGNADRYRAGNVQSSESSFTTIEKLLDLPHDGTLSERAARLAPFFSGNESRRIPQVPAR